MSIRQAECFLQSGLHGNYQKVQEKYPDKCKKVEILFDKISDCERETGRKPG